MGEMSENGLPAGAVLSEEGSLAILDHLSDGVYFTDRQRRITYWNKAAERLTGYSADEVVGRRCRDGLLNHCDAAGNELCGKACPLLGTIRDGQLRDAHVFLRHKDGHRRPVWVRATPLRDAEAHIVGAIEVFNDDSALVDSRRRVADLQRSSLTDALTGTGNRRLAEMTLAAWLVQYRDFDRSFGVLFADIDHFKVVNDTHGHHVGDEALRVVARTLQHGSRHGDEVVRWGGEEFVILAADADAPTLAAMAERLRALVEQSRLFFDRRAVPLRISIGATVVAPGDDAGTLIRRADALLYRAKVEGRNRVVLDIDER